MRLLNSLTIKLEFSVNEDIVDYAILSHIWEDKEVSFQGLIYPSGHLHDRTQYNKIKTCCGQATSDEFTYIRVDTCCIDKTSSAELFEAINFMYQCFTRAKVCYAYLIDVPSNKNYQLEGSASSQSR